MIETPSRYRLSAKQTAKNLWQLEGTVENADYVLKRTVTPGDAADVVKDPMGLRLLSMIKEAEKAFRADGRRMVGDE